MRWIPAQVVKGVPHDMAILGYKVNTANTLRLWKAEARESFDFQEFNVGDYYGAVHDKVVTENITKVLYPNDEPAQGKQLRLEQQYFFVSCSLQDMIRIHLHTGGSLKNFHEAFAVQLNDTHPSIGVAELMRLLVDKHQLEWDAAWDITRKTFAYTNHTLLPEALEKWPINLFGSLLPRHLEIIYEINRRFLDEVRLKYPNDASRIARMSLIDESEEKYVRMAYLATVGSHKVNGVAELHSQLLKETTLHDFYELWPEKFLNVTNGVAPRRFVVASNARFSSLATQRIGHSWIKKLDDLRKLEPFVDDPGFRSECQKIKLANKQDLAGYHPWDYYHADPHLRAAVDLINSGHFSHGDTNLFKPLVDSLIKYDPYMLLADYQSYVNCQELVSQAYKDGDNWTRMSILNMARMGKFSSDRAIREYCEEIWSAKPVKVEMEQYSRGDAV